MSDDKKEEGAFPGFAGATFPSGRALLPTLDIIDGVWQLCYTWCIIIELMATTVLQRAAYRSPRCYVDLLGRVHEAHASADLACLDVHGMGTTIAACSSCKVLAHADAIAGCFCRC